MSKKKDKEYQIEIEEFGGSCCGVTGSCTILTYYDEEKQERRKIMLELGLIQKEQDPYKLYIDNSKMLQGITKDIITSTDYVILSHSHIDHVGNLAYMNTKNGFEGKIISSKKTISISKKLIADSVYIHEKNIEQIKNGTGKRLKPLYTEQDMYDMFSKMEGVNVGEKIVLNKNITIQLHANNHSVGSVAISVWIKKPTGQIKHILYSGDCGSKYNFKYNYFTDEENLPRKCNVFLSEYTYCKDGREFNEKIADSQRKELKDYIKTSLKQGKRVLVCTFAYNRTQQFMQQLFNWYSGDEEFTYPIVIDGFLSNKINDCFSDILEGEEKAIWDKTMKWGKFKFNREYPSTLATLSVRTPGLYIASSGFLTAGRSLTYLQSMLGNKNDCIIAIGYYGDENSKGYAIFDSEQKTVTIGSGKDKRVIYKRAECRKFSSFSSHIQKDETLKLWSEMKCDYIIVHHSEATEEDMKEAKNYLREKGVTIPLIKTNKGCYRFVL